MARNITHGQFACCSSCPCDEDIEQSLLYASWCCTLNRRQRWLQAGESRRGGLLGSWRTTRQFSTLYISYIPLLPVARRLPECLQLPPTAVWLRYLRPGRLLAKSHFRGSKGSWVIHQANSISKRKLSRAPWPTDIFSLPTHQEHKSCNSFHLGILGFLVLCNGIFTKSFLGLIGCFY